MRCVKKLLMVLCMFLFLSVVNFSAASETKKPGPPQINIPEPARSHAAIQAIADNLPALAEYYGKTPQELKDLMLKDLDLWIDPDGQLFQACTGLYIGNAEEAGSTGGDTPQSVLKDLSQTFLLHSRPNSNKTIYLDFDGHVTSGTQWNTSYNGGADIISPAFDIDGNPSAFSNAELQRIQYIWARVAEDYAPFDVDVTTEDPGVDALRKTGGNDTAWGIRVLITINNFYPNSAGGVAYLRSFTWNTDTPCWVFTNGLANGNEKYTAEAASHEAGHTLNLYHDGDNSNAYYQGHGSGETGWAPIMGVGYYRNLTQWSKGEYTNANNSEDDLSIITSQNGFGYIQDDYANNDAQASWISNAGGTISVEGIIENRNDIDVFVFIAGAGNINLSINPYLRSPDLDVSAELYDEAGTLIASSNPATLVSSNISTAVSGGEYYLRIQGVGAGTPPGSGYTDYASLGYYTVSGTVSEQAGNIPPIAQASATPSEGEAPLTVSFSSNGSVDPDGVISIYDWSFGDGNFSSEQNPVHTYQQEGIYYAFLSVLDNEGLSDSTNVVINVLGQNILPTAVAIVDPSSGNLPLTVSYNASSSFDPDGTITSYFWSFGDGYTATTSVAAHTYTYEGTFSGYLLVTDNRGGQNQVTFEISVADGNKINAPANLSGSVTGTDVTLTWTDSSNNEEGFKIERAVKKKGKITYVVVGETGVNVTAFTETGLSGGTYSYRVTAFNLTTGRFSDPSNTVQVTVEGGGKGGGGKGGGKPNR